MHTPGPWKVEAPFSPDRPSRIGVSAAHGCCTIYDAPLTNETEANAALIAAAPDLEEALRGLLDVHSSFGCMCHPCATARAALAKAEGR